MEFVCSAGSIGECPAGPLPEVAVSGRSNVGKSSLLNHLVGKRRLAQVSKTPGKTQRLHFFLVNGKFHLVDLPGYGYARVPESVLRDWRAMMQGYLRQRRQLCGVLQLVDSRHPPSRQDCEMVEWLLAEKLDFCLVTTKMDKLRPGERQQALGGILRTLRLPAALPFVPFSSQSGEGVPEVGAWLAQTVASAANRPALRGGNGSGMKGR